jgi:hypothetical protein
MMLAMGAGTIEVPVAGSVCGPGMAGDTKTLACIEGTIIVDFIETDSMFEIDNVIDNNIEGSSFKTQV